MLFKSDNLMKLRLCASLSEPTGEDSIRYIKYTSQKLRAESGDIVAFDGKIVSVLNRENFRSRDFVATRMLEADFLKAQQA